LALAGLGAAALGQSRGWWVFWVAVLLAPIGIALVSELGLNGLAHQSVSQSLVVGGAGAVFLAIGVGGLVVAGLGATYVLALGAVLYMLLVGSADVAHKKG